MHVQKWEGIKTRHKFMFGNLCMISGKYLPLMFLEKLSDLEEMRSKSNPCKRSQSLPAQEAN
jgi:hypothetical protein